MELLTIKLENEATVVSFVTYTLLAFNVALDDKRFIILFVSTRNTQDEASINTEAKIKTGFIAFIIIYTFSFSNTSGPNPSCCIRRRIFGTISCTNSFLLISKTLSLASGDMKYPSPRLL